MGVVHIRNNGLVVEVWDFGADGMAVCVRAVSMNQGVSAQGKLNHGSGHNESRGVKLI